MPGNNPGAPTLNLEVVNSSLRMWSKPWQPLPRSCATNLSIRENCDLQCALKLEDQHFNKVCRHWPALSSTAMRLVICLGPEVAQGYPLRFSQSQ